MGGGGFVRDVCDSALAGRKLKYCATYTYMKMWLIILGGKEKPIFHWWSNQDWLISKLLEYGAMIRLYDMGSGVWEIHVDVATYWEASFIKEKNKVKYHSKIHEVIYLSQRSWSSQKVINAVKDISVRFLEYIFIQK